MLIEKLQKYDHVYDHLCSCGANYHMQKHPLGTFVIFEDAKVASLNSTQQLKAEILPLIDEAIGDLKLSHFENAAHWLNEISAKLSAVWQTLVKIKLAWRLYDSTL